MTASTHGKIPAHLQRYIVDQDYSRYTAEDQAVWRYIMRQLKNFLSEHGHESYLEGLRKTGLKVESIPRIEDIDAELEKFGWGAVPVSGFIPPAAFMEFQSIGVLPIASDMRTLDHLLYTPAPDIVHEAAGHAPILVHPEYAAYLRQYGEVARRSIISKQDMDQYEAIRVLSDIKEDPRSTSADIADAEQSLSEINRAMRSVSEAALLSRMNWWTAEYGLIGDIKSPKLFGAGLLSSVGESRACLGSDVKKLPLSVKCVDYSYDITEQQPQLFVTENFAQLGTVLEQLAARLSYRRGGAFGLKTAIEAETVNTVQLNSGLQISGVLKKFLSASAGEMAPIYLQLDGPTQLAVDQRELEGHGCARHAHGFSSPLGLLKNQTQCLSKFSPAQLSGLGIEKDQVTRLEFASGVCVEGQVTSWTYHEDQMVILSWTNCTVTHADQLLFDPAWGEFDMAVGCTVTSVYGGPADRENYGEAKDFPAKKIPQRGFSPEQLERYKLYKDVRALRESATGDATSRNMFTTLTKRFLVNVEPRSWLLGVELLELSYVLKLSDGDRAPLLSALNSIQNSSSSAAECVRDGIGLAAKTL